MNYREKKSIDFEIKETWVATQIMNDGYCKTFLKVKLVIPKFSKILVQPNECIYVDFTYINGTCRISH